MLLLDIVVPAAARPGWNTFLAFVPGSGYDYSVVCDDSPAPLPTNPDVLFPNPRYETPWRLRIRVGSVDLHCFFFDEDDIELDFPWRDVASEADAQAIFGFMASLANALNRECRLTNEADPRNPILRAVPGGILEWVELLPRELPPN